MIRSEPACELSRTFAPPPPPPALANSHPLQSPPLPRETVTSMFF